VPPEAPFLPLLKILEAFSKDYRVKGKEGLSYDIVGGKGMSGDVGECTASWVEVCLEGVESRLAVLLIKILRGLSVRHDCRLQELDTETYS
jgi:hypothetical protein